MQLEAQRIVASWLADATDGVNAKLAVLSYDGTDTQPADLATITAACDNPNAAFGRLDGLALPAVIVAARDIEHRDPEIPQPTSGVDGVVTLLIRYGERTGDPDKALRNGAYVTKAILASLRELHANENAASRTRNGIQLWSCEGLREPGVYEETNDAWLISAVEVRYHARDLYPMGA